MNAPAMDRPSGLWSLLDMLERYALLFSDLTATLTRQEEMWGNKSLGTNPGLMTGESESDALMRKWRLDDTLECLDRLRAACEGIGLPQVTPEIGRIYTDLRSSTDLGMPLLSSPKDRLKHLRERIRDELQGEYFLHVGRTDVALYGQREAFGADASLKFPLAAEDIEAAGNCLVVGQPTACVFHLMRVMEIGVRALAKKLKVRSIDPQVENWNVIGDHINKAIAALPSKTVKEKARKSDLAGASVHLNGVRIAQRNEVMHPKKTYTLEEARDVYQATRLFMRHLAGLV